MRGLRDMVKGGHDPTCSHYKRAKPTHTDPEDDMNVVDSIAQLHIVSLIAILRDGKGRVRWGGLPKSSKTPKTYCEQQQ